MSSNGSGLNGQEKSLVVGQWIRATLDKSGTAIEGQIFTFDESTNCVVLQSPGRDAAIGQSKPGSGSRGKFDFHFLKVAALKDVVVIPAPASEGGASEASGGLVPVGNLNVDKIISRENHAVKVERDRIARIGVGVSKEAQHIFDALSKTMPCTWNNDQILILGQVVVLPPYGTENVHPIKGADTSRNTLDRVKLVLENEKKRLGFTGAAQTKE